MNDKLILPVQHNPGDMRPARRALAKSGIGNRPVAAENGQEALDYLFGAGPYDGCDLADLLVLLLLDPKLPKR